jgi:predicted molibdopterin-dependent oxidoreductase YjgC
MLRRMTVLACSLAGFSKQVRAAHQGESEGCHLEVDGLSLAVIAGQSLAAALVEHGVWAFRRNPITGEARGPYCGMGVCFECEVEVDDRRGVRACMAEVADGMVVRTLATPPREQ